MKHFMRTMSVVATLALLFACNSDYNFDKISLEVTLGDTEGITVPLGSTEKITVESLLGEQNDLTTNPEGFYSFGMSDDITEEISVGTLAPITGLAPSIAPTSIAFVGEMSATIPAINETKSVEFPSGMGAGITVPSVFVGQTLSMTHNGVFSNQFNIDLPSQVKSVEKVTFGAGGSGSEVSITFNIGGLAAVTEQRVMEFFKIEAPAGFELQLVGGDALASYTSISKGAGSTTNNHFEVNNLPMSSSSITLRFKLMSATIDGGISGGKLQVNNDISFDYKMSYTVKSGTIGTAAPYVQANAGLSLHQATVELAALEKTISVEQTINKSIDLPEVISEIHSLAVSRTDLSAALPALSIDLGMSGSPINTLTLAELALELPSFLDFEVPQGWTLSGGILKATNVKLTNDAANNIIRIALKGIKNIPIENKQAKINGKVAISASIKFSEGEKLTIGTAAKEITFSPNVKVDDMKINSVVGRVSPDLDDLLTPIEVDLSSLTSVLGEDMELSLNLSSPTIDLSVENPIGVGIDLVVKIDAWKGGVVSKSISTPTLTILGAEGTTPTTTKLSLTGDTPKTGQTKVEGLNDLINSLPDKLTVTLDAATNNSKPHTLIVKDSYLFKVNYAVNAALKFDASKNGVLKYTTVIEDIDLSSVADVDIAINSITVNVESQSTLPLDASVSVKFLDEAKNEITQIKTTTTGKIKGSIDGTAATSNIALGVNVPKESSAHFGQLIGSVKAVECTFEGVTLAGAGLKPDQWLQATLSLCLDEGITVDLGTLAGGAEGEPTE